MYYCVYTGNITLMTMYPVAPLKHQQSPGRTAGCRPLKEKEDKMKTVTN